MYKNDLEMQNNDLPKNNLISIDNDSECESETDSEDKNKFLDININSYVYHKFIIKSINDDDDKIYLVATGVQKCLIPYQHEEELKKHLQFDYRINNEAQTDQYIKER